MEQAMAGALSEGMEGYVALARVLQNISKDEEPRNLP